MRMCACYRSVDYGVDGALVYWPKDFIRCKTGVFLTKDLECA